ncbi:MAG: hypothetical protein ACOH5I_26450 [Oligoflexus sp.]
MSQSLNLKIAGLFTSVNDLSSAPEGSLLTADNIVLSRDHLAEPRRGFDRLTTGFSDTAHRSDTTFFYQDKQFAHHGTLGSAGTLSYLDGTWQSSGSFTAPSGFKMRALEANQNLYFTSSEGVYKLDAFDATPQLAGANKGLDISLTIVTTAGGFLATSERVAYRVVFGYTDENNNKILGTPSGRAAISNSGTAANVTVRATLPSTVAEGWFYQIYRSGSVSSSIEPDDELQLVYEQDVDATDVTNKYVEVTDIVPDALRGAAIYTAPSQQGIAAGNERPPLAKDIANFRDVTFYANTTSKHRFTLTLTAVGGSGLVNDDTITIGGVTYTGKATEDIANAHFEVVSTGTPATDIADTAASLIRVINRHSSSTVYATYLSGPDDLPGRILIEERGIGGSAFTVASSRAAAWTPSNLGTAQSSANEDAPNGLMWSKPFQPEAVPLTNQNGVGDKNAKILRIVPLREALLIFKEDGIYKLTGFYPNFNIDSLSSSAKLVAPESCAILNDAIIALTDQGVVSVEDSVKIISEKSIIQDLRNVISKAPDEVKAQAFGIGYETERTYAIYLPSNSSDTAPQFSFVYNVFTRTWVKHLVPASCGVVHGNHLYLGDTGSNYFLKDRKTNSFLDYADFGATTSISSVTDDVVTLGSSIDNAAIGGILWQSDSLFAVITDVDPLNSTVTVRTDPGFTTASATILKAISTEIEWVPVTLGNPAITKQLHTVSVLFKSDFQGDAELGFSTDKVPAKSSVVLQGTSIGSWGLFPWGAAPWGGDAVRRPIRQWIPRQHQRCSQVTVSFSHAVGYSPWQMQGLSIFGTTGDEKVSR